MSGDDPSRADPKPPHRDEDSLDIPFDVDPGASRAWDADDPRRQHDEFAPPTEPCECYCLHCQRTFTSDRIWFQKVIGDPMGFQGFWMCPTPNCEGKGFTFDIFPTDPNHPANDAWDLTGDNAEDGGAGGFDEQFDEYDEFDDTDHDGTWSEGGFDDPDFDDTLSADAEYDPDEPQYKALEQQYGTDDDEDDFFEGDEWKLGLEDGQAPWQPRLGCDQVRHEWDDQEKRYDEPDRRPREVNWSNRDERDENATNDDGDDRDSDEDIPF